MDRPGCTPSCASVEDIRCSRKRVERLMRQAGVSGIYGRRRRGCTRRDPAAEPADDLVNRDFDPVRRTSCGSWT